MVYFVTEKKKVNSNLEKRKKKIEIYNISWQKISKSELDGGKC